MMMEKTCSHLILIVLSISSLLFSFPGSTTCQVHPPPSPPPALNLTVEQICQNTSYPSLCNSALTPFPSQMDSPQEILSMAVKAALNSTQVALSETTRLLSDPSTPSRYQGNLQNCSDYYTVTIQELQIVVEHIANGIENDITGWLGLAQEEVAGCEIEYAQMDLSAREAGEYDAFVAWLPEDFLPFKLSDMVRNCLDITRVIHWPPAH